MYSDVSIFLFVIEYGIWELASANEFMEVTKDSSSGDIEFTSEVRDVGFAFGSLEPFDDAILSAEAFS